MASLPMWRVVYLSTEEIKWTGDDFSKALAVYKEFNTGPCTAQLQQRCLDGYVPYQKYK